MSSTWAPFAIATIPAATSILAAWIAARSARQARTGQEAAEHRHRLEQRVADRKREVYQPMIEFMGRMFDDPPEEDEVKERLSEFARWVTIVGSDEALLAFHNMMQASYHSAPAPLLLRLYAEFQLAARRDMGDPLTAITPAAVLGMRITDLYSDDQELGLHYALTRPIPEVARRHGWDVPWPDADRR